MTLADPSQHPSSPLPRIVIAPSSGWVALRLNELWAYRELLFFLVWRDIKIRYKQTVLGAAWVIIQPLATTLIFTLVFGRLVKIPTGDIPYPIFAFAGLLPWQFFASAIANVANSMVNSAGLIRKVYFPRLAIPIASTLAGLVDFGIAFVTLLGMLVYYGIVPTIAVLTVPLFVLLAIATVLGLGLWLSALNVQYRDVRQLVPFLTQFWLYATPVVYPSSLVKEPWHTVLGLNPMAGVVEGFRWALLGGTFPAGMVAVSTVVAAVLLVSGLFYFRRMERQFADIV